MSKIPRVVILGGGFGGLAAANKLRGLLDPSRLHITLVDKKDWFMVGFAKLWIINGTRTFEDSTGDMGRLSKKGIEFVRDEAKGIDFDSKTVRTATGTVPYDFLIIALGARLAPEKVPGLVQNAMNLYDHGQLTRIRDRITAMRSGRLAICIAGMPYKCPPAPYEAGLLISSMLADAGVRDSVRIDIYSPAPITLPAAGPRVSQQILEMISAQDISFHGSCKVQRVEKDRMIFENDQADFDLLLAVPPHVAPGIIYRCGLAEQGGFIRIDRDCRTVHRDVYAVGDVTALPVDQKLAVPKAGVFAEGEGEMVAQNIVSEILSGRQDLLYGGEGGCFLESGHDTASVIEVDMFGGPRPATRLTEPTRQNLESKFDFERERLQKWL